MLRLVSFVVSICFVAQAVAQGTVRNDFDGDGISDLVVWRPSTGVWFVVTSSGRKPVGSGWFATPGGWYKQWGLNGDTPLTGDLNGDRISDAIVVRPVTVVWYIARSSGGNSAIQFGLPGDRFALGDVTQQGSDATDGKDDLISYRPTDSRYYIRGSRTGVVSSVPITVLKGGSAAEIVPLSQFRRRLVIGQEGRSLFHRYTLKGQNRIYFNNYFYGFGSGYPNNATYSVAASHSSIPLLGDYDGNGDSDLVMYENGNWRIIRTAAGYPEINVFWGSASELPVVGDYDGDGKDDLATWHKVTGDWRVFSSGRNSGHTPPHMTFHGGYEYRLQWGLPGDALPG